MGGAGHPPVLEAAPQVSCRVLPPPHPNQALSLEHLSGSNVPPIPTAVSPNLTSQAAKIAWQLPSQSPHLQPSPCTPGCPVTRLLHNLPRKPNRRTGCSPAMLHRLRWASWWRQQACQAHTPQMPEFLTCGWSALPVCAPLPALPAEGHR